MEIFLDSAIVNEIRDAHRMGLLSGVTTNPTLVAKSGRNFHEVIREICSIVEGLPVSAEVTATDAQGMIEQGRELAALAPNVVVKVPLTPAGLEACHALSVAGIATNLTLVFSANQGLLAARAGATYVSPFIGRLDDINQDGMQVVRDLAAIFRTHNLSTRIIAASCRHPRHATEAALAGAHIATIPFAVLKQMWQHPLTDSGLARFLADWEQAQSKVNSN